MSKNLEELRRQLKDALIKQGAPLDLYDPDFILGVLMYTLADMDAALTSAGVRRFKRK